MPHSFGAKQRKVGHTGEPTMLRRREAVVEPATPYAKRNLELVARRPDGIFVVPFEQEQIGPDFADRPANSGWKI
jgi:hypothetical protein